MISVFPVFYCGIYKPVIPAHGLITNLPKSAEYAIFRLTIIEKQISKIKRRNKMKNDHTFVYKFFLFSLAMPERMAKYLEKMRKKGYKLVEIRYSCIFVFKKQEIREDLKYVILTEHYRYNLEYKKRKWDDVAFLERRNPQFHGGNGEQCDYLAVDVWYHVYLTRFLTDEDLSALHEYRKRYMIRGQIHIIIFLLSVTFVLIYLLFLR